MDDRPRRLGARERGREHADQKRFPDAPLADEHLDQRFPDPGLNAGEIPGAAPCSGRAAVARGDPIARSRDAVPGDVGEYEPQRVAE